MPHPLPFVPPELIEGIPLSAWADFLSADAPSARAVADALAEAAALRGELDMIAFLATPAGRDALCDAADDVGYSLPEPAGSPALRAIAVVLAARTGDGAARVLARAAAAASRLRSPWVSFEYAGPPRATLAVAPAIEAALAPLLAAACARAHRPGPVRVTARRTPGVLDVWLVHPTRASWTVIHGDAGKGEARVVHGVTSSHARYDARSGTLRVWTREPRLADAYRRVVGTGAFDGEDAFRVARLVSLTPLGRRGTDALTVPRSFSSTIAEARVIAWEHDRDDDHIHATGHDVVASAQRRGERLEPGRPVEATIRFQLTAGGRVDVTLREPATVVCSAPHHEPMLRTLLASMGILDARREAPADLWSLEPWSHPEPVWMRTLGAATVAALREGRALVPVRSRVAAHPDFPDSGRALVAMPLATEPGAWWGTSDDPAVPPRTLSDADRDNLWLDLKALAATWQTRLGLTGAPPVRDTHGVLDLGVRRLRRGGVHVFLVAFAPGTPARALALAERVRRAAAPDVPVLLVPEGRTTGTGLAEVPLGALDGDGSAELRQALREAGLLGEIDLVHVAPPSARIVYCTTTARAWLDRVPLAALSGLPLRMLELLATRAGEPVATRELGEAMSRRGDAAATAHQTRGYLIAAIRKSFADAGSRAPRAGGDDHRRRKARLPTGVDGVRGLSPRPHPTMDGLRPARGREQCLHGGGARDVPC